MNMNNYIKFMESVNWVYNDNGLVMRKRQFPAGAMEDNTLWLAREDNGNDVRRLIEIAKPFEVDNEIKKMLLLTTPPKNASLMKLPFPVIFIDIDISHTEAELDDEDNIIYGMLVVEREVLDNNGQNVGRVFDILHRTDTVDSEGKVNMTYVDEAVFTIEGDKVHFKYARKKTQETLQKFLYNFILFLNQPEVQIVEVVRTKEQQFKRMTEGKIPLPPSKMVRVTGILKKYINTISSRGHFSYSHRFWVRGHWRTLRNPERYREKVGTMIWILPYIKGKGMLIDKSYKLTRKLTRQEKPKLEVPIVPFNINSDTERNEAEKTSDINESKNL